MSIKEKMNQKKTPTMFSFWVRTSPGVVNREQLVCKAKGTFLQADAVLSQRMWLDLWL